MKLNKPCSVVLAGAGHSHLQFLKWLIKNPLQNLKVILINPYPFALYSGMLPSFLARDYNKNELQIDLKSLCQKARVEFYLDEISEIRPKQNQLICASSKIFDFEFLSLNLGSKYSPIDGQDSSKVICLKPFAEFFARFDEVHIDLSLNHAKSIAVVGGGAAAIEVACALKNLNSKHNQVSIISSGSRLLASASLGISKSLENKMHEIGIICVYDQRISDLKPLTQKYDWVFVSTNAAALTLWQKFHLPLNSAGFIQVADNLKASDNIFASGDCASFSQNISKSGVHAVRQGELLIQHFKKINKGNFEFNAYVPQKRALYLLNLGQKQAQLIWGNWHASGHWAWRLKQYIDLKYIRSFN